MKASITILSLVWALLQLCLVAPQMATALAVEEDHPEERGGSLRARELANHQKCGFFQPCRGGFKCLVSGKCTNGNDDSPCIIHGDCHSKKCQSGKCASMVKTPTAPTQLGGGNDRKCSLFKPCQRGFKCLAFKGKCTDGKDGSLCSIHGDCDSKKCQSGKCATMVKTPTAPTRPSGKNFASCSWFSRCAAGYKCLAFQQKCTNGWDGAPCIFSGDCKDSRICSKGKCAERQTSAPTAAPTTATPIVEDVMCPCWDYENDFVKTIADRLINFVVAGEEVFMHAITETKDFDGSMSGIYMVDTPEDDTGTGDPAFWVKPDESSGGTECSYIDGDTTVELPLSAAEEGACRSDIRHAVKEAADLFAMAVLKTSLADGTCPCEEPRSEYSGTIELELMLHGPGHQEALVKFGDEANTVEASVVVENGSETITCDSESIDLTEISKAEFGSCAKPVLDAL